MKKFFNWVLVLCAFVGVFYGVGMVVPRSVTRSSKTQLQARPEELYTLVTDVSTWPKWHPDVSDVDQRPERNDHPLWRVTTKDGRTYELEVSQADEDSFWQASYTLGGSRCTLRMVFGWAGEGGRLHLTKTVDTKDPWMRARLFLWEGDDSSPLALLNAIAAHLGEAGRAEED